MARWLWLCKAAWARMGPIWAARACSRLRLTGAKEWVSWAPWVSPASRRFLGVVISEPAPGGRGAVAVQGGVGVDGPERRRQRGGPGRGVLGTGSRRVLGLRVEQQSSRWWRHAAASQLSREVLLLQHAVVARRLQVEDASRLGQGC
jgi:hypothetical protein